MPLERTLSIMKPDAIRRRLTGTILVRFEQAGLVLVASKMLRLTKDQAEGFYAEHTKKPFFNSLIEFMTSGPILVEVFQGENAVKRYRDVIGNTDPELAAPGTVRADFAESKQENGVHGSDSPVSAAREIAYFFSDDEIFPPAKS